MAANGRYVRGSIPQALRDGVHGSRSTCVAFDLDVRSYGLRYILRNRVLRAIGKDPLFILNSTHGVRERQQWTTTEQRSGG